MTAGALGRLIGREDSADFAGEHREELRWIGRPWRRCELLTNRHYYRGEECGYSRDLTLHLGLRRLRLAFTLTISRADALDYSEERP